jgi:hypothetical protein
LSNSGAVEAHVFNFWIASDAHKSKISAMPLNNPDLTAAEPSQPRKAEGAKTKRFTTAAILKFSAKSIVVVLAFALGVRLLISGILFLIPSEIESQLWRFRDDKTSAEGSEASGITTLSAAGYVKA